MSQVEYDVDKKGEEEEKEEFVAVEEKPEGKDVDEHEEEKEGEGEKEEESRLGGGRDEDETDDDKKARRREENKTRRQRQKVARERTDRELKFLRTRNETLERRFSKLEDDVDARVTGSEVANVDTAINKAKSDLTLANQVMQQAMEANNPANFTEAMDHRDTIRDNLRELEQAKEYLSQETRQPRGEMEMDPRHVAHAQSFMVDHDWWDPRGTDADSQAVLAIDRSLAQEGFNPTTKDYWDTLRTRVQAELPHHFGDAGSDETDDDDAGETDTGNGKDSKGRRKRGPEFRTGGRERPLGKNEVYISPERKAAMVEAGVWEDPVLRQKFLKAYATYDQEEQPQEGA